MIDFERARRTMVDTQIRTGDVTDQRVLEAFLAVPRELFVPEAQRSLAYRDRGVQIAGFDGGPKRFLLDPLMLAKLLQLCDIDPGDTVLDIGCGNGYAAAVMASMARRVIGVEGDPALAASARATVSRLGIGNVEIVHADPAAGHAPGPYDAILIEGAVDYVPETLHAQLADGGRMAAVVGAGMAGKATLYTRAGDDVGGFPAFDATLPPLPGFQKAVTFVF